MKKKFEYYWRNKEANFGPPIEKDVNGGTHITFEIVLKKGDKFIALRRPEAIPGHELPPKTKNYPNGLFYFCHNLIRYGEPIETFIKRTVKEQAGVGVKNYKILDISSEVQDKDDQWAFTPYVIAEVEKIPQPGKYGNDVTEVITFDKHTIPEDFGWWTQEELKEFLEEYGDI